MPFKIRKFKSKIIVATEDPRLFYFLSKKLNEEGFAFHHVSPKMVQNELISTEQIVLTTFSESVDIPKGPITLTYDDVKFPVNKENIENFFYLFKIWIETGRDKFDEVVIGIDPGHKHTGIALFINKALITVATIPTGNVKITKFLNHLLEDVLNQGLKDYPVNIKMKIGNGNPIEMKKLVSLLLGEEIFSKYKFDMEIVDEFQTNTPYRISRSKFMKIGGKDEIAAINIGLRQGKQLSVENFEGDNNKITRKQLKSIQDESRKFTKNTNESFSINEKLATKVLLGKLSLPEAIKMQKLAKKRNKQA